MNIVSEREFSRPGEVLEFLNQHEPSLPKENRRSERPGPPGSERYAFTQTESLDEAKRMFLEGWPAGLTELALASERIERSILDRIPTPTAQRDVTGTEIDMAAYLSGAPEPMIEWHHQPAERHGVQILVNIGASQGVKPRVIMTRGAAVVALANALQVIGIPAEVFIGSAVKKTDFLSDETLSYRIQIMRPGWESDMSRVAFMLAHPSMLRRIIFAIREREPAHIASLFGFMKGNYGAPTNVPPRPGEIVIDRMMGGEPRWSSPQAAAEWVLNKLAEHGVEMEA